MPYHFVEGVALADLAFEATGASLGELFASSGQALFSTMMKDLSQIKPVETKTIHIEAKDEERLLHDFLQELIFLKDAELLVFCDYAFVINKDAKGYTMDAYLRGEKLDPLRHDMLVDAKAISWHMFKVEKTKDGWKAFVIVDV